MAVAMEVTAVAYFCHSFCSTYLFDLDDAMNRPTDLMGRAAAARDEDDCDFFVRAFLSNYLY